MPKAVIILSGGMDSTTLLYDMVNRGYSMFAISFDYQQKHAKEIECARKTCVKLGVPHQVVDLSALHQLAVSSLTRDQINVPEGNYDEPSMKATVVPNRNMVMISLAAAYAISNNAPIVYYGAHAGDHTIYPDCRPPFIAAMNSALRLCDWTSVELRAPYMTMTKGDIATVGKSLNVDYSLTWTCYKGGEKACGKCGSCRERLEAFETAGFKDPIEYME
jgi:7-cyano-7-deazaguanine synthase